MKRLIRCRKNNKIITGICTDNSCPWAIDFEDFYNCSMVACYFGPLTTIEIGKMMNVTHQRIEQIEKKALVKIAKLQKRKKLMKK